MCTVDMFKALFSYQIPDFSEGQQTWKKMHLRTNNCKTKKKKINYEEVLKFLCLCSHPK